MRSKWWVVVALCAALGAFTAWASEAEAPQHGEAAAEGHEEKHDAASFIFHHVTDSNVMELDVPPPFYSGHNPKLDLGKVFSFLRFETTPGVCPADLHELGSVDGFMKGCIDLRPTKHLVMLWLASLILVVGVLWGSHRDKKKPVPHGTSAHLFEILVLFVRDDIAIKNIGKEEGPRYVTFLLSAFFFILFANLLGLFPFMATATGNLAVTAGLAICTFVLTQIAGIRAAGLGGYLKHLTGGVHWLLWPIMVPVEILGLFTKPFALTMRLFANMLAGHIVIFFLLSLIFIMSPAM
ncbi:MAG: F0F1 ATP synthase subunit A, partial [Myxococcaceae bacterium]